MTITQQQTFNPPFSNPDDMPEYVSIYEMKPKRKSGRPRTCTLTDEQKKRGNGKLPLHGVKIIMSMHDYRVRYLQQKKEKVQNSSTTFFFD